MSACCSDDKNVIENESESESEDDDSNDFEFVLDVPRRIDFVCQKAPRATFADKSNESFLTACTAQVQPAEPSIFEDDNSPTFGDDGVEFTDAEIAMMAPRRSDTPDNSAVAGDSLNTSVDSALTTTTTTTSDAGQAVLYIDLDSTSSSTSSSSCSTPAPAVKTARRVQSEPSKKKRSLDADDDAADDEQAPSPKTQRAESGKRPTIARGEHLGRFVMPSKVSASKPFAEACKKASAALEKIGMLARSDFPQKSDGTANFIVLAPGASFTEAMALHANKLAFNHAYVIHLGKLVSLIDGKGNIVDGGTSTLTREEALDVVKRAAYKPRSSERVRRVRVIKNSMNLDPTWSGIWNQINSKMAIVEPYKPEEKWNHPQNDGPEEEKDILLRPATQRELVDMLEIEFRFADHKVDTSKKDFETLMANDEQL